MGFGRDKPTAAASTSPCANLKLAYHNCFNRWYSEKFVKKQWDEPGCADEWEKYRACLSQHLEDKHLSRFLEAGEALFDLSQQTDSGKASDVLRAFSNACASEEVALLLKQHRLLHQFE